VRRQCLQISTRNARAGAEPVNHDRYEDTYIAAVLSSVKTMAMVGASANENRPSYFAMKYLIGKGYRVIPVNPGLAGQTLLGETVVGAIADLAPPVDMIDVFRNSEAALEITEEAIRHKERLGLHVLWMQLGVFNAEAAAKAEAAGLRVVMNRCPKIEYGRLSGEIGWMGVNNGLLSSRRPLLGPGLQSQVISPRR
jgi:hypothetical protein